MNALPTPRLIESFRTKLAMNQTSLIATPLPLSHTVSIASHGQSIATWPHPQEHR